MDWKVEYYQMEDGTEPVTDFINALPQTRGKGFVGD